MEPNMVCVRTVGLYVSISGELGGYLIPREMWDALTDDDRKKIIDGINCPDNP